MFNGVTLSPKPQLLYNEFYSENHAFHGSVILFNHCA